MLEIIISFKRNWCSFERKHVGQKRKSLRLAKGCFYWRGKLLLPLAKNSWRQPEMKHYITQERCSLLKKLLTEELHRRILPIYSIFYRDCWVDEATVLLAAALHLLLFSPRYSVQCTQCVLHWIATDFLYII